MNSYCADKDVNFTDNFARSGLVSVKSASSKDDWLVSVAAVTQAAGWQQPGRLWLRTPVTQAVIDSASTYGSRRDYATQSCGGGEPMQTLHRSDCGYSY